MLELVCFAALAGLYAYCLGPWVRSPESFVRRNSRGAFMRELNDRMLSTGGTEGGMSD